MGRKQTRKASLRVRRETVVMTSRGKYGYKLKFGTREYHPISTAELKELVESLCAAPEGATIFELKGKPAK
jgi:hypothetical protein